MNYIGYIDGDLDDEGIAIQLERSLAIADGTIEATLWKRPSFIAAAKGHCAFAIQWDRNNTRERTELLERVCCDECEDLAHSDDDVFYHENFRGIVTAIIAGEKGDRLDSKASNPEDVSLEDVADVLDVADVGEKEWRLQEELVMAWDVPVMENLKANFPDVEIDDDDLTTWVDNWLMENGKFYASWIDDDGLYDDFEDEFVKNGEGDGKMNEARDSEAAAAPLDTKYYVEGWWAETYEDRYEEGEVSSRSSANWDSDSNHDSKREFSSVEEALRHVTEANYFDWTKDAWEWDEYNGEFRGCFLVDEDNSEASDRQIEDWKKGDERLWNCYLNVRIQKIMKSPLSDEDLGEFERI